MMKLLVTGGHVTPALAVIDRIKERKLPVNIVFVGRKYTNDQEKDVESFEYKEVSARKIPFIHLSTGRLTRIASIRSLAQLLKLPQGFISAYHILKKEKPDAILSFGGYIALPIAIIAKFLGIKVYTHEQTFAPGLANKYIAQFADTIFLSFPESAIHFKGKDTVMSGNPIRRSVLEQKGSIIKKKDRPVVYVTGGSLGAHAVNVMIEEILGELLERYYVIHQTGNVKEFNDFDRLSKLRSALPPSLQERYIIKPHVSDEEIGTIYHQSDVVVGRAGANTFFELVALQKPAVFIPLPWSAHNEQEHHAQIFKQNKTGEVVLQSQSTQDLLKAINTIIENQKEYQHHFSALSTYHNTNAADLIIDTVLKK